MFTPINTKDKLYKKVLSQLQDLIIGGTLKGGDKLPPERQMAESLGVSRPALKQALSILEALNIVECRQGDGNYILPLTDKLFNPIVLQFYIGKGRVDDILEVRYILEVQTAKLVSLKATSAQIEELEKILERMEDWKTLNDRILLNNEFHSSLIRMGGNPLLTSLYNSILDLIALQIHNTDGSNFHDSHKRIVDAIRNKNPEEAARCMKQHFSAKFPNYEYYAHI